MRHLFAAAMFSLLAAPLVACEVDAASACREAYTHLSALGKRRTTPELEARFLASCIEAEDAERIACLLASRTPGEALACKARRKRPG